MAEETAAAEGKIEFTAGESALLVAIMQNLTSDIQFDADAIATQLGYKDGGIVKTRWGQIKRKKLSGGSASPAGIKKRTPAKKGAAKNGNDDGEETPTKTPKKRAGKKAKAEVEETEVKGEEEEDVAQSTENNGEGEAAGS